MIDKKKFLDLCSYFNNILKSKNNNFKTISIPWLHIIRAHPIILEKYSNVYSKSFIKIFFIKIKNKVAFFIQILRSFLNLKNKAWSGVSTYDENIDYLFISHLINKSHLKKKKDFYFGNIPNELKLRNNKVAIALINYTNVSSIILEKESKNKEINKYYFSKSLSFKNEWGIHKSLLIESRRLKNLSNNKKYNNLEKRIYDLASFEAKSNGTHFNLRLHCQINLILKKLKPKVIVTTYEGHAYERIVFHSARLFDAKIKCVSYQHTGVFKLSNAIKIKLSKEYNPDFILTSGLFGKEDLEKSNDLKSIPILEFGSNRGLIDKKKIKLKKIKSTNICLVIPEGFLSECNILFNFSFECAKKNPNINFLWRLHPGIDFKEILKQNKNFKKLPKNIYLSSDSLENDIAKCNWVLYRGSSAIFKAISYGLRPFYFGLVNEISIDPLFKLDIFKKDVISSEELIYTIKKDIVNDFKYHKLHINSIRKFCEKQFSKINIDIIDNILKR